jgi:hypothetical protein
MLWGEWADSKYNIIGITNGNSEGDWVGTMYLDVSSVRDHDGNPQLDTDVIVANAQYIVS